jgi:hypothetical protein
MSAVNHHTAQVDAWLKPNANGLPPELLLRLFERALEAMWQRTHLTLGAVTLTAIVDRVLHTSAETYPLLSAIQVEADGIRWAALHERADGLEASELIKALRLVLIELLTILGNLTAEILTPALWSELSKVRLPGAAAPGPARDGPPAARQPKRKRG